ncbi:hypothetical protein INR49_032924 [Caranx melampygus]|nr:hypothetical protein INR49_032924 [Caranx melampygus]
MDQAVAALMWCSGSSDRHRASWGTPCRTGGRSTTGLVELQPTSGVCFTTSLIRVVTFFLTYSSGSLRQVTAAGKMSASTTISARSTECLLIWLRAENTCLCTETQTDVTQGGGSDAFEGQLGLPETHHQQRDSACIHNAL